MSLFGKAVDTDLLCRVNQLTDRLAKYEALLEELGDERDKAKADKLMAESRKFYLKRHQPSVIRCGDIRPTGRLSLGLAVKEAFIVVKEESEGNYLVVVVDPKNAGDYPPSGKLALIPREELLECSVSDIRVPTKKRKRAR